MARGNGKQSRKTRRKDGPQSIPDQTADITAPPATSTPRPIVRFTVRAATSTHRDALRELLDGIEIEGGSLQTGTTAKLVRSEALDAISKKLKKYGYFPNGYPTTPLPATANATAA